MAAIKMISENEAEGKVKKIYNEIMERLGIDFVPNLGYRLKPGQFVNSDSYLEQYFYTAVEEVNHPYYERPIQKDRESLCQITDWLLSYRQIVSTYNCE